MENLLSVFVYQFEDCINACASYNAAEQSEHTHLNSSCAGVSFDYTQPYGNTDFWGGNCFLKAVAFNPASSMSSNDVDSAFLTVS